jgi:hypothetical protein
MGSLCRKLKKKRQEVLGGGKEEEEHSEWGSLMEGFLLGFGGLLGKLLIFLLRQCLVELLCDVLMQLLWRVMLRNYENLKGSEP